jgi:hypothetical protein
VPLHFLGGDGAEEDVEGEPDDAGEGVKEDGSKDGGGDKDVFEVVPRDVGPHHDKGDDEASRKDEFGQDDVKHHAAEEIVLGFATLEAEPAGGAADAEFEPGLKDIFAPTVRTPEADRAPHQFDGVAKGGDAEACVGLHFARGWRN